VKEGSYVIIDGEPCKIVEVEKSKPGKHGSAKEGRVRLSKPVDLGDVKEGSYVIIDGEPCKIVEVEKSKPGK
jgi:translation elongation factor P/translation initiation factor 5A